MNRTSVFGAMMMTLVILGLLAVYLSMRITYHPQHEAHEPIALSFTVPPESSPVAPPPEHTPVHNFDPVAYSPELLAIAQQGLELYYNGEGVSPEDFGQWVSPKDGAGKNSVWTDGIVLRLDREDDGLFETIFTIDDDQQLEYVGTINTSARYVDTNPRYRSYLNNRWVLAYSIRDNLQLRENQRKDKSYQYSFNEELLNIAKRGYEIYAAQDQRRGYKNHMSVQSADCIGMNCLNFSDSIIRLDRESDGHHETVFRVVNDQIEYIGSIGRKGFMVHTAEKFSHWLNTPVNSRAIFTVK